MSTTSKPWVVAGPFCTACGEYDGRYFVSDLLVPLGIQEAGEVAMLCHLCWEAYASSVKEDA